jgi:hypothetical protein
MTNPITDPNDDGTGNERTFSRAELAKASAKAVRDAVARVREEYGDYADLKAKAAEADKGASQLDKMQQQLADLTKQNADMARDAMVRRVADKLNIPVGKAERLRGNTEAELLADGEDFFADWKRPGNGKAGEDDDNDGNGDDGKQQRPAAGEREQRPARPASTPTRRERPRETLRSGTPTGGDDGKPEETDPLKLAALAKSDLY